MTPLERDSKGDSVSLVKRAREHIAAAPPSCFRCEQHIVWLATALEEAAAREADQQRALVAAAEVLEVLAGQIRQAPYAEMTTDFQVAIDEAAAIVRGVVLAGDTP